MPRHLVLLPMLCALGCKPSEETRFLSRLVSSDAAIQAKAENDLDELPDRSLHRLLLAGMQSSDLRIAQFCALRLEYNYFSMSETPRWIALMRSLYDSKDGELAFELVRRALGSADIEVELRTYDQKPGSTLPLEYVHVQLHRQLRREHIPLLCELILGKHEARAKMCIRNLGIILCASDHDRELVATTLLSRPYDGNVERLEPVHKWVAPAKPDGYPPALHACLAHFFSPERKALVDNWPEMHFRNWLLRWAQDCKAGPSDRALLLSILDQEREPAPALALHGLRDLADPTLIPILRDWVSRTVCDIKGYARLLLAELGEQQAHDELEDEAKVDSDALAYLMQVDARSGRKIALQYYLRTKRGEIPFADQDYGWARTEAKVLDPERDLDWIQEHFVDDSIPLATRLCLMTEFSRFRTRANALLLADGRIFRKALASGASQLKSLEEVDDYFALLEVVDRKRVEELLTELAKSLTGRDQGWALTQLLRMGSAPNDQVLIDFCGDDPVRLTLLGRTRTEPVRQRLLQACEAPELEQAALQGLVIHSGLPFDTEVGCLGELSAEHKRSIREGRAVEVFLAELKREEAERAESESDYDWTEAIAPDPALLQDPRVTAWLLEQRKDRSRGDYWSLTLGLARQGHPGALEEVAQVLDIGRYEWIENLYPYPFPRGDLSAVPRLIQELESACCRTLTVQTWLDQLAPRREWSEGVHGRSTPISEARRWWKEAEGNLHYSQIAESYVLGKQ